MSPFNSVARILWDRGYSIVPIMPSGKMPAQYFLGTWSPMVSWNKYGKALPSENEINQWSKWNNANIGLATGEASYLVALDFDEDDEGIHQRILDVIPHSPVRKVGNRGFTIFYQFNGELNRTWARNKKPILELLSTGRQTVLPPSIHPSGGTYHYTTEDTLETVNAADLPTLPDNFIELMDGIFGVVTRTKAEYKEYHGDTSVEEVERAIEYISPDDYYDWLDIGMALSAELGDAGFAIWDKWSQGSAKYKAQGMQRKYDSFRGQGIGIGTLFHMAILGGYIHVPVRIVYHDPFVIDPKGYIGQMIAAAAAKKAPPEIVTIECDVTSTEIPVDLVVPETGIPVTPDIGIPISTPEEIPSFVFEDDFPVPVTNFAMPHGLVGEIAHYMNRTAIKQQPILAVAAALVFVGMVKGHRVQSATGLRTNMYAVGLGESGCGKDHPLKCIEALAEGTGLDAQLLGTLVSGPGILKGLKEAEGRAMVNIDEMGLYMAGITSYNAQSHQKEIITNIMKLYSSAGRIFRGAQYANAGARSDIKDPCFSIFGLSTGSRFWGSLSGDQVIDGFLNRILVVASDEHDPDENEYPDSYKDIPQEIIDKILAIEAMPTNVLYEPGMIVGAINPRTVHYTADAEAILREFKAVVKQQYNYAFKVNDKTYPIWKRVPENTIKVALILQEGDFITAKDMKWACDFVYRWTVYSIDQIKTQISDSSYEKSINKIVDIIRKYQDRHNGEGIPHGDLSRATSRWLKMKERNDILGSLLEDETIFIEQEASGQQVKRYCMREK